MDTLLLSQSDVKKLLTMKDFIEITDKTFHGMGDQTVINPTKIRLNLGENGDYPHHPGGMNCMPAYVGWQDIAGIKWIGSMMTRKELGLPIINGMILLADPNYLNFVAVVDGTFITNMRTGAQTAVALRHIYKGKHKQIRMCLYGCGAMGPNQIHAVSEVADITQLKLFDVLPEAAGRLQAEVTPFVKGPIIVCESSEQAAQGVDIVVSVTRTKTPFFKDEWFHPGMVVFALDTYQMCEDNCILNADKLIVDHPGQCLHRGALKKLSEEQKITEASVYATIGELACGSKTVEHPESEKILVEAIGIGALDVAAAAAAFQRALDSHTGGSYSFDI